MSKIKNPCKFCRQATNNKNGLQCQGACRKWMHFKCAEFTPEEITDIRAGIIEVICPCPDCDTVTEEELPAKCSNDKCPATKTVTYPSPSSSLNYRPDECGSKDCPSCNLKLRGSIFQLKKSNSETKRPSSSCGTEICSNQNDQQKKKARPIIICCGEHTPEELGPQACKYKCLADSKTILRPSSTGNPSRSSKAENFNIVKSLSDTQIPIMANDENESLMETLSDLRKTMAMLAAQLKQIMDK